MEWFKHDTSATTDAKIKKLVIKYGATGYAIYFHCLELIAGDLSQTNLTFQLEHDSEIIADDLKITGTSEKSGQEIVEDVMHYMVKLGLFSDVEGRIYCFKLLHRLDTSMTSNDKFRKMITDAKKSHDAVMTPSCKNRIEEKRVEENRVEYADGVYLTDEEYSKLLTAYEKDDVDFSITSMAEWQSRKGAYKNHYLALLKWLKKDVKYGKIKAKVQQRKCPECGAKMLGQACSACEYAEEV